MNDKRELARRISRALEQRQERHKQRLIISGVVGIIVMFVYVLSQQPSPQRSAKTYTNKTKIYTFNFPMSFCGDKTVGGTNTWYPVYINYSQANLNRIRKYYCCDAYYKPSAGVIIVGSLYNRSKAYQLVAALKSKNFQSARVGKGRRITTTRRSYNYNNCRR